MNAKLILLIVVMGAAPLLGACTTTPDGRNNLPGAAAPVNDPPEIATPVPSDTPVAKRGEPGGDAGAGGPTAAPANQTDEVVVVLSDPKVRSELDAADKVICAASVQSPQLKETYADLQRRLLADSSMQPYAAAGLHASGRARDQLLAQLAKHREANPSLKTYAERLAGGQSILLVDACALYDYLAGESDRLARDSGQQAAGAAGQTGVTGIYAALDELGKPSARTRLEYIEEACRKDTACLAHLKQLKDSLGAECPQRAGCADTVTLALIYGKAPATVLHRQGVCPVGDCARIGDIEKKLAGIIGPRGGAASGDEGSGGAAKPGDGGSSPGGGSTQPGGGGDAGGGAGDRGKPTETPVPGVVPGPRP